MNNLYGDLSKVFRRVKINDGGAGSGNYGHKGRKGEIGGSGKGVSTNNPASSRLYGADRFKKHADATVRKKEMQAYESMKPDRKKVYDKIIGNEAKITKDMENITNKHGLKMTGEAFAIKMPISFNRKVDSKMLEKQKYGNVNSDEAVVINSLNDVVRYTAVSSANNLVEGAIETLNDLKSQGHKVIEAKNSWNDPYNPYNGINVKLQNENGVKYELQFHTPQSYDMKERKQHKYYELARQDDISEDQKKLYNQKMFDLVTENPHWAIPKNIERLDDSLFH